MNACRVLFGVLLLAGVLTGTAQQRVQAETAPADSPAVPSKSSAEGDKLLSAGRAAQEKGKTAEAATLFEQALQVYTRDLGPDQLATLAAMTDLATADNDLKRTDQVYTLDEAIVPLMRTLLGAENPHTLGAMSNLANDYDAQDRLDEALTLREQTLALRRKTLGNDDPDTLASMTFLAASYSNAGRDTEALALQQEADTGLRKVLGADHHDTLANQGNMANSYANLGRQAEALKLREDTLSRLRKAEGDDALETLSSMGDLANSYATLGRQDDALKLREETYVRTQDKLGVGDRATLGALANLGNSYSLVGRKDDALKIREKTLELRRQYLPPDDPETLVSMANLAASYSEAGRDADALKLDEETLTLKRAKLGPNHPETLLSMANLAKSYSDVGRKDEALKLEEQTLALRRTVLGNDHPATLISMNNLAYDYYDAGRHTESKALRRELLDGIDHTASSLNVLTRDQRSTALASYQSFYSHYAQELDADPADFAEALTVTERAKARSLLEELTARQAISNSGIPPDEVQRLTELHARLEKLDGNIASTADSDLRLILSKQRELARTELDGLNQTLTARYPRYAALSVVKPVTLDEGRALLPAHGVFISWLFDDDVTGVGLALPASGAAQVLSLGPGPEMLARAETYRWLYALPDADSFARAVQATPLNVWQLDGVLYIGSRNIRSQFAKSVSAAQYMSYRQPSIKAHGEWLSATLLEPLAAQIDPATQWIISPDGILATIPWDTLPWHGKPLGQQKQLTVIQSLSVYRLLKEREAEHLKERATTPDANHALLVMGGADYGAGTVAGKRSFQRSPQVVVDAGHTEAAEYQRQSAFDYMRSRHWPNLAGSLNEAQALHTMLPGQLLTGRNASETRLRELSQSGELASFRNLHFAAHGYLDTSVPSLSALVLSRTGNDEDNDGYVTAGEWPAFNLKSDLLVMSACETGLGKVISGEGVQGLPYALYVAGNQDTLLSLWQVSDNGTSVFMERFWKKIEAGQSHAQALTETKREFQHGDFGKAYAAPYYWAAFVLYGVQE
jgi:CHAT domain-containing protein/tetratricopeptide (TPR) repeat protein